MIRLEETVLEYYVRKIQEKSGLSPFYHYFWRGKGLLNREGNFDETKNIYSAACYAYAVLYERHMCETGSGISVFGHGI